MASRHRRSVPVTRLYSKPSAHTFLIPSVADILKQWVAAGNDWADPFANNHSPAEYTNDLNPEMDTEYHLDAVDFLKMFDTRSLAGVLLDPPCSHHQATTTYDGYGTKRVNVLTPVYDQVARVLAVGGLGHQLWLGLQWHWQSERSEKKTDISNRAWWSS